MSALKGFFRRFWVLEQGLVTTEWIALTAGMIVAAIAIGFLVMSTTAKQGNSVTSNIISNRNTIFGPNGSKLTGS